MRLKPFAKFSDCAGIDNKTDTIRLGSKKTKINNIVAATNADVDNNRMVSRRAGYTELTTGNFHSLWANGAICLVVEDSILKRMYEDYTRVNIKTGVNGRWVSYVDHNGIVYATDGIIIGYVLNGAWNDFPAVTAEMDIDKQSVIDYYTATRINPPAGQIVRVFNNRLYVARNNVIWFSDPMAFHRVKKKGGFIQMDGYVTLMEPVDDGIWVSDGNTHFLAGMEPNKFNRVLKAEYSAVINTAVDLNRSLTGDGSIAGQVKMWSSEKGVCLGASGGQFSNLTLKKYTMPTAKVGAAIYKEDGNKNQYISVLEN